MSATLTYWVKEGGNTFRSLRLTLCTDEDMDISGLAERRRKRLCRLLHEALSQGARLSYGDLSMIMLSSRATLKRDVSYLRKLGMDVPLSRKSVLRG